MSEKTIWQLIDELHVAVEPYRTPPPDFHAFSVAVDYLTKAVEGFTAGFIEHMTPVFNALFELTKDPDIQLGILVMRLNRFMPYRVASFIGYRWPERWLK